MLFKFSLEKLNSQFAIIKKARLLDFVWQEWVQ